MMGCYSSIPFIEAAPVRWRHLQAVAQARQPHEARRRYLQNEHEDYLRNPTPPVQIDQGFRVLIDDNLLPTAALREIVNTIFNYVLTKISPHKGAWWPEHLSYFMEEMAGYYDHNLWKSRLNHFTQVAPMGDPVLARNDGYRYADEFLLGCYRAHNLQAQHLMYTTVRQLYQDLERGRPDSE